jgi:hypothetical protein
MCSWKVELSRPGCHIYDTEKLFIQRACYIGMMWTLVMKRTFAFLLGLMLSGTVQGISQEETGTPRPVVAPQVAELLPGFRRSPWFGEQVREEWIEPGVRVLFNAPPRVDPDKPTRLIIYATPNGNTIEQTMGCALAPGTDWHYDIQHIAAQTRRLRELLPDQNIVVACVEAEGLSWPAWRQKHPNHTALLDVVVQTIRGRLPNVQPVPVTLAAHSGGGSFIFGFINGFAAIPDYIERIILLDANYAYDDISEHHGDKIMAWIAGDARRHLVVLAYDDRSITLNGKAVVGPDGGTFRASQRMLSHFGKETPIEQTRDGDISTYTGLDGRILFCIHQNPANKILHTALVGEMNGFIDAVSSGSAQAKGWGVFGTGPRAYTGLVQPAAALPARPVDAPGGAAFMKRIAALNATEREEAIAQEICAGNIPDFLRNFQTVTAQIVDSKGVARTATYQVMPDYLAVGSDTDFVRVPMTPQTAQRIADAFGCSLPTRKMVDDIYRQAAIKLEPRPLVQSREAIQTFVEHNGIIEEQRQGIPLASLVAGIKKDVVITNRLLEKPGRVAIYGWHKSGGTPIQPLTIVHAARYVDYSHGIRLIKRGVLIDGKPYDIRHALHNEETCTLLSDEGPIRCATY